LETARIEIASWEKLKPRAAIGMNRRKERAVMRRRLHYTGATRDHRGPEAAQGPRPMTAHYIWDDLFHGCAFMAYVERSIIEQGPPAFEATLARLPVVRRGPGREEPATSVDWVVFPFDR
jgi:hypothetical protein